MLVNVMNARMCRAETLPAEFHPAGSCAIDEGMLRVSGLFKHEQAHGLNVNNGECYVIDRLQHKTAILITVKGAAAHYTCPGDRLMTCAEGTKPRPGMTRHKPQPMGSEAVHPVEPTVAEVAAQTAGLKRIDRCCKKTTFR